METDEQGTECDCRHEMPVQNDLSKQNIQDRYHGRNDPVANKIMNTNASNMGLAAPEDTSIVSLAVPFLVLLFNIHADVFVLDLSSGFSDASYHPDTGAAVLTRCSASQT